MIILSFTFPDELAELEKLTKVANEDLVRHWLDDLAGNYKLPRARALETSWSDDNAWHKQCNTIIDALIKQIPAARQRWGEHRAKGEAFIVTPGVESMEELKDGDQRWRAEQYVQLPLRTGIRNAKVAAFLETDLDAPHFVIPAGGRMREAFEHQVSRVYWELQHYLFDLAEAANADIDEPRSARLTAQYNKLCRILGIPNMDDDLNAAV
jgi:hypothetical protein